MSNVVLLKPKEQEETMTNVEYLKLALGGKEPPADGNWLSLLDKGTMFLVQKKQLTPEFQLGEFVLMDKTDKSVIVMTPDMPGKRLWWNPVRFCHQFSLWEILGVLETSEVPPENKEEEDEHHRVPAPTPET